MRASAGGGDVYQFAGWQDTIKQVSTDPQFQNAAVVLYVPGAIGEYDPDAGTYEQSDPVLVYEGRCRVVGLRSAGDSVQAGNPDSLKPVRIQLPKNPGRMPDNTRAYFADGGRNENLTTYVFNVNSDFNSSHVAAYTLELTVSMDATDEDRPVFPIPPPPDPEPEPEPEEPGEP